MTAKKRSLNSNTQIKPGNIENQNALKDLRDQIDAVDKELIKYLDQRAELVNKVGKWKKQNNKPIFDPQRESEILNKVIKLPHQFLKDSELQTLFQSLMEFYRNTEKARTVIDEAQLPSKMSVGFYGFGLIGASVGMALREKYPNWKFVVYDPFIEHSTFQKWNELEGKNSFDLVNEKQLSGLDFVFLGAPVDVNLRVAESMAKKNKFVLDLGSYHKKIPGIYGFHPLAGKEKTKFTAAQADLFYGKILCLSNIDDLPKSDLEILKQLANSMGSDYWIGDTDLHNHKLAYSSHLVQILAMVLGECLNDENFSDFIKLIPKTALELTRLTGSSPQMWDPVFRENKVAIKKSIEKFQDHLTQYYKILDSSEEFEKAFSKSLEVYQNIFLKKRLL